MLRLTTKYVVPPGIPWATVHQTIAAYMECASQGRIPIAEDLTTTAWNSLYDSATHESYAERLGIHEEDLTDQQRVDAEEFAGHDISFDDDVNDMAVGFFEMYECIEGLVLELLKVNDLSVACFSMDSYYMDNDTPKNVYIVNTPQIYVFDDNRSSSSQMEMQAYFHTENMHPETLEECWGSKVIEEYRNDY